MLLRRSSADILVATTTASTTSTSLTDDLTFSCPPDRWGSTCENICKPCGLGVCHATTGKCICPTDIYGEFCDLWKGKNFSFIDHISYSNFLFNLVNDKPKRGDMTS